MSRSGCGSPSEAGGSLGGPHGPVSKGAGEHAVGRETQVTERTTDGDPVHVADLETRLRVVLIGLGPVYRHGLSSGLTAAGMLCSSVVDPAAAAGHLRPGIPVVLVVAQDQVAGLLPVQRSLPAPAVNVVHVLTELSVDDCSAALRAGATGLVAVDAELDHVVEVVRAAAVGRSLLPAEVARALCRPQSGPRPQLSPREREWLRRLAESTTVSSLARGSGYSEREMYRLLAGVYTRLGASGRTEALLLAERWGLLDLEPA